MGIIKNQDLKALKEELAQKTKELYKKKAEVGELEKECADLIVKMAEVEDDCCTETYETIKRTHEDAIILVRSNGEYRTYGDDAKAVSEICVLEMNGKGIVRFSEWMLDTYLPKLIRAGRRVCIADYEGRGMP